MPCAVTQVAVPAATGTQDITVAGTTNCKGAIFWVTSATANGALTANAHLCFGMTDGTNNRTQGSFDRDNEASQVTGRRGMNDKCIFIWDVAGSTIKAEAHFDSFINSGGVWGVRINWTTASATAFLLNVILLSDDMVANFHVNDLTNTGILDATADITTVGFQPDSIVIFRMGPNLSDTNGALGEWSVGFVDFQPTITQGSARLIVNNAQANEDAACIRTSSYGMRVCTTSAATVGQEYSDPDASGFSVTTRENATAALVCYGAIKWQPGVLHWVGEISTPTGTGNQSVTSPGFTPAMVLVVGNNQSVNETFDNSSEVGSWSFGAFTSSAAYSASVGVDDAAATMITRCAVHSRPLYMASTDPTTIVYDATFVSMDGVGWTWNFGATDATARKMQALAASMPASIPKFDHHYRMQRAA